jgi:hypothetical protein
MANSVSLHFPTFSRDPPFGPNRQFVAQLLLLYLTREKDSLNFPSLSAPELDELYHERTDFIAEGPALAASLSCSRTRMMCAALENPPRTKLEEIVTRRSSRRCRSSPSSACFRT